MGQEPGPLKSGLAIRAAATAIKILFTLHLVDIGVTHLSTAVSAATLYKDSRNFRPIVLAQSTLDSEDKIQKLLPILDKMVAEGLIAISDVEVIKVHQQGTRSL